MENGLLAVKRAVLAYMEGAKEQGIVPYSLLRQAISYPAEDLNRALDDMTKSGALTMHEIPIPFTQTKAVAYELTNSRREDT